MKATSRRSLENLSPFLAVLIILQGLAAASAQSAQPNSRLPKISNAPAVGLSNPRLQFPFFYFYKFTPIADTNGGFPFESILGPPSINSDAVIALWRHGDFRVVIGKSQLSETAPEIILVDDEALSASASLWGPTSSTSGRSASRQSPRLYGEI